MSNRHPHVKAAHLTVLLALMAGGFSPAYGAALDVGGAGRFPTIQQAVNAARRGDVVRVAAGTYVESVVIQKSLTILGGFDPTHTVQNPDADVTLVLAACTSESARLSRPGRDGWRLSGLQRLVPQRDFLLMQAGTIRRVESASAAAGAWRIKLDLDEGMTTGPVRLIRPRDAVFRIADENTTEAESRLPPPLRVHLDGLVIAGGWADRSRGAGTNSGGGIHFACYRRATFALTRSRLIYNTARSRGGGAWVDVSDRVDCEITSCTVAHNVCSGTSESAGGGLAVRLARGSQLLSSNNRIGDNRSGGDAGGADVEAESGCYVRWAGNSIERNAARENAGGLAARIGALSLLESDGNRIESNGAENGSCGGGYVELWGNSRAWLSNDRIVSNRAALACGGFDLWVEGESRCEVSGGCVRDNEAGECGGFRTTAESASEIAVSSLDVTSNRATAGESGGWVARAEDNSQIEMTSATIAANRAADDCGGGDLVAQRSSGITLVGCEMSQNETGGASGAGRMTGLDRSVVELRNCRWTSNRAAQGSNGVGLFDFTGGSRLRIEQCQLEGNRSAGDSGVGVFNFSQGSGGEIAESRFRDNLTSGSGGIGFVQATDDSSFRIQRCEVSQNAALGGSYGALCLEAYFGSSLDFVETVFDDNQSSGPFGAVYVYSDEFTSVTLAGCQFLRNRAEGGSYGACAIEVQRDSPVSIHSTQIAENMAVGDYGGLYVAASERSPVALFDCRIHHNVALRGDCGALAVVAEDRSVVSIVATHCWANRAYGDAGAVQVTAGNDSTIAIADCDWYDNIAWSEATEQVVLAPAGEDWRIAPASNGNQPPQTFGIEPGDLITQGSLTWAVADVAGDATSPVAQLAGANRPRAGAALRRRVGGDGGAFVLDQRNGDTCFVSRVRAWNNRAGRDSGAGLLIVLDASTVELRECAFSNNVAGRDGGALGLQLGYVERAIIERNGFESNRAGSREDAATGGFCGGLDLYAASAGLLFSGNSFRANRSLGCGPSGGDWGASLLDIEQASALEFVRNEVRDNQADRDVGGVEIACHDLSVAAARDNPITDNRAARDVGGLAIGAGILTPVTVARNEFRSNRAGACGGALALRASGGSNGYVVERNQFSRNEAPAGSGALVLGPATFQHDRFVGNLDGRAGTVCLAAADAAFGNETLADNQGVALSVVGGTIRSPARLVRREAQSGNKVEIETTSPSLGALLLCARHLPVYLIQGATPHRLLDAEPSATANVFRLRVEQADGLTTGDCELATQARRPVKIARLGLDWLLMTPGGEAAFRPEPGQHILQGTVEAMIVDAADESPPCRVVMDDDTDLADGEAILVTTPPVPALLRMVNSTISGSSAAVYSAGDVTIQITPSNNEQR